VQHNAATIIMKMAVPRFMATSVDEFFMRPVNTPAYGIDVKQASGPILELFAAQSKVLFTVWQIFRATTG
jgi:hypothetical protein